MPTAPPPDHADGQDEGRRGLRLVRPRRLPPAGSGAGRRRRRSRRLRRPRLLGAPAVPRRPVDPGAGHRRRLLRAVVPPRRPEPPALGPGVARSAPAGRCRSTWSVRWPPSAAPSGSRRWSGGPTGPSAARPGGGPALAVPIRRPRSPSRPRRRPSGTPTTTTTLPPLDYHPTPATPLKVLIVGDSVGLDLGQPLVNTLAAYGDVTTYLDGRIDTGLTRPDYFNWPAELQIDLTNQQPNLVVVMIGANDPQGLVTPDGQPAVRPARVGRGLLGPGGRLHRRGQRGRGPRAVGRDAAHAGPGPRRRPQAPQRPGRRPRSARTKDGGASYLSSVPALGDQHGRLRRLPARRLGCRGQRAHPRRHPPDPRRRGPPGRRGGGRHADPAARPAGSRDRRGPGAAPDPGRPGPPGPTDASGQTSGHG